MLCAELENVKEAREKCKKFVTHVVHQIYLHSFILKGSFHFFWCKLESLLSPAAACAVTDTIKPFNERVTTHAMIFKAACENLKSSFLY